MTGSKVKHRDNERERGRRELPAIRAYTSIAIIAAAIIRNYFVA